MGEGVASAEDSVGLGCVSVGTAVTSPVGTAVGVGEGVTSSEGVGVISSVGVGEAMKSFEPPARGG